MNDLTLNNLVGAVALLSIITVLSIAALTQGNHDALIALISLVTGGGIGVGASVAVINRPRVAPSAP